MKRLNKILDGQIVGALPDAIARYMKSGDLPAHPVLMEETKRIGDQMREAARAMRATVTHGPGSPHLEKDGDTYGTGNG